jgi:hypothetical protein
MATMALHALLVLASSAGSSTAGISSSIREKQATIASQTSEIAGMHSSGPIDITSLKKGMSLTDMLPMSELRPKADAELATRRRLQDDEQPCYNFGDLSFMPPYVRRPVLTCNIVFD